VQNAIFGFAVGIKHFIDKAKLCVAPPSSNRLNQKSSKSQQQINCTGTSFAARQGILLCDPIVVVLVGQ
jgi:hypothetical protein